MASGTQSAIINFPGGIDIYYSKIDYGTIVSGENHAIPISSPYQFYTAYTPLYGAPGTTTSIPGFLEVTSSPGPNQYLVTYSGNNASLFTFSSFNAGNAASVTYTAAGGEIIAEWFNSLQTSVTGIEAYIISSSGNSGNVQITGSTMTGQLTMNGANIATAVSGQNQIGTNSLPFGNVVSEAVTTQAITSFDGNDSIVFISGATHIFGNEIDFLSQDITAILSANDIYVASATSGVNISAGNGLVSFDASPVPTGSFVYDLGSSSQKWRTIYADDLSLTNNPYVAVTGDSMSGNLTMEPGASVVTNSITSNSASINIFSPFNINETAMGNITVISNSFNANDNLVVTDSSVVVNSAVLPLAPNSYDLGSISNPFRNIYADSLIGASISGTFVHITGDTMTGDLNLLTELNTNFINSFDPSGMLTLFAGNINVNAESNIMFGVGPSGTPQKFEIGLDANYTSTDIIPNYSGTINLGAPANYYKAIYVNNLAAGTISSGTSIDGIDVGLINVTGTVVLGSGASIIAAQSGTVNIGSSGNPIGIIYANTIVTNGTTGNFISKYGDNVIGTLVFGTGAQITYAGSGINTIGSAADPLGTLYVNNIVSSGMAGAFVPITGGSMTGPLTVSTILSTGNMLIAAAGNLTTSGNNIYENGESINLLSTNGPIMLNANTEMQVSINSLPSFAVNTSGIQSFANAFPNVSGTLSLGTPMNPWAAVYANSFIGVNATGGIYVLKAGDTMAGNLTFNSGVGVAFNTSGTSNIGSPSDPANAIYANNIVFTSPTNAFVHVTGDTMTGSLSISSGGLYANNLYVYTIGNTFNIGSGSSNVIIDANPGDNAYISVPSGASIKINDPSYSINLLGSGITTSGNIIPVMSGIGSLGTIASPYGSLNVGTANISSILTANAVIPSGSGIGTIGTLANPYSNIVTKSIDGILVTISVYNEIPSGLVNGSNSTFTTAFLPVSGTQRLFRAGLRMSPNGIDYNMSGNTILFNIAPISGDNLNIDYKRLP